MIRIFLLLNLMSSASAVLAKDVGLGVQPSLTNRVAHNEVVHDYLAQLETILNSHAQNFNSYMDEHRDGKLTKYNPELIPAIFSLRNQYRTSLRRTHLGNLVLQYTAIQLNLERLIKIKAMTEHVKTQGESLVIERTLNRLDVALRHTYEQLEQIEPLLDRAICADLLQRQSIH